MAEEDGGGRKKTSFPVKVFALVVLGAALGIAYNEWSGMLPQTISGPGQPFAHLDLHSYGIGLVAGMVLWQIVSVPWSELPGRVRQYLLSKTHIYQFVAISAACVLVLIYL